MHTSWARRVQKENTRNYAPKESSFAMWKAHDYLCHRIHFLLHYFRWCEEAKKKSRIRRCQNASKLKHTHTHTAWAKRTQKTASNTLHFIYCWLFVVHIIVKLLKWTRTRLRAWARSLTLVNWLYGDHQSEMMLKLLFLHITHKQMYFNLISRFFVFFFASSSSFTSFAFLLFMHAMRKFASFRCAMLLAVARV